MPIYPQTKILTTITHSSQTYYLTLCSIALAMFSRDIISALYFRIYERVCRICSDFLFVSCDFGQIKIVCVFYPPPPTLLYIYSKSYVYVCLANLEYLALLPQIVLKNLLPTLAMLHYSKDFSNLHFFKRLFSYNVTSL